MSDIKVHNFSDDNQKKELKDLFFNYFKQKNFVPIIGSGYTRGEKTSRGVVPSVDDLKGKLYSILTNNTSLDEEEKEELKKFDFFSFADLFWNMVDDSRSKKKIMTELSDYINSNFTRVNVENTNKRLLFGCNWKYVYTINYDDAIETIYSNLGKDISVVLPFDSINQYKQDKQDSLDLYKLHGDAKRFYSTGEKKYLIMGKKQYLGIIGDEENKDLRIALSTDFASSNLIFIGCSLTDELDILLSSENGLVIKKKKNSESRCFFVAYTSESNQNVSYNKISLLQYSQYGITDIIIVSKADFPLFYQFLKEISDSTNSTQKPFENFRFFNILEENGSIPDKINYIFENRAIPQNGNITLPPFFTRRTVAGEIINDFNNGTSHTALSVIRGNHFSGKTYVLLDILKNYQNQSIFYFKSGIQVNDDMLTKLFQMNNSIFLFDENTINSAQIYSTISQATLEKLEKKNNKLVICINRNIGIFTPYFYENKQYLKNEVKIYELPSFLEGAEVKHFNEEIGNLGISNYKKHETILDYALRIHKESLKNNTSISLPDYRIWNNIKKEEHKALLKILIILSNQDAILMSTAIKMNIDNDIMRYCKNNNTPLHDIIQMEMLAEEEMYRSSHDCVRFCTNSRYWIYRCLFNYSETKQDYDTISSAYFEIVSNLLEQINYETVDKRTKAKLFNKLKAYYFLDSIQDLFFHTDITTTKGSITLIGKIYDKLLPVMKNNYQFLHQKAKFLLRKFRINIRSKGEKRNIKNDTLNEAFQQINRAINLAEENGAVNARYSIAHMQVTKLLILLNDFRYCRLINKDYSLLTTLIEEFHIMLQNEKYIDENLFNKDFDRYEVSDIKWLAASLATSDFKEHYSKEDKIKANDILNDYSLQRILHINN